MIFIRLSGRVPFARQDGLLQLFIRLSGRVLFARQERAPTIIHSPVRTGSYNIRAGMTVSL